MSLLRPVWLGVRSGERNAELVLLLAACGFALLAQRALAEALPGLPADLDAIVAQFLATAILGHIALRLAVPHATAVPYATAMLLAAVGIAFVVRLAPEVGTDQARWISLGVGLMVIVACLGRGYAALERYRYTCAAVAVALLLVTGVFGTTINGARLWITVGDQVVQTTEIIKVFVVVFLAGYLAREGAILSAPKVTFGNRSYSALPALIPLIVVLAVTIGVLALLKDLGTVALLVILTVGAVFVATGRLRYVLGGVVLLGLTGALGYVTFDHAQVRIDTWLHPYDDPSGSGYQTIQATYAISAGGITGTGLGLGAPDTIPAAPTDYVYSAVAEELGLAGALAVVLLYVVLLVAGLRVASEAPDSFGRMLAATMGLLFAVQAGVIIAGNLRIIPTTGITLPFVSYGGSSLIVNFMLVGLLLGISDRSHRQA